MQLLLQALKEVSLNRVTRPQGTGRHSCGRIACARCQRKDREEKEHAEDGTFGDGDKEAMREGLGLRARIGAALNPDR